MKRMIKRNGLTLAFVMLGGCAGYDRALLVTKTNVGLDVDTTPPTAELTISRRELAIQPTFPNYVDDSEQALPMLAAFGLSRNFINPRITANFAGGDAAVYLANESVEPGSADSALCLSSKPKDTRNFIAKLYHKIMDVDYEEEPRPFYFATDTSYGVKVAWSGTAGPYPDTLKIGYNRKEFASPPIFVQKGCQNGDETTELWSVKLPSFYAAIDNANAFQSFEESGTQHVQFFATGKAATEFAKRPSVRRVAFENMAPVAAELENAPLNKELIAEIESKYADLSSSQKQQVIKQAQALSLVPEETTPDNFLALLKKQSVTEFSIVSYQLNKLRSFASAQ